MREKPLRSSIEKNSIRYSATTVQQVVLLLQRILKEVSQYVPKGWNIGRSDSDWMTSATFFEYIDNIFDPWLLENHVSFPVITQYNNNKWFIPFRPGFGRSYEMHIL